MENQQKVPSLEKYFSESLQNDTFFDHLSTNSSNSRSSQVSAMMSSLIESKSTQDLLDSSQPIGLTEQLETPASKIFSPEPQNQSATFFDTIGQLSSEIVDNFQGDDYVDQGSSEGAFPSPLEGFDDVVAFSGPEFDRTRESWIPSESTRRALIMAATSNPGTYNLDKDTLTMPGVILEEELVDPVGRALRHLYGGTVTSEHRKVLTVDGVSLDEMGLRQLISNECYRAAVNLTSKLLTLYGQGVKKQGQPSKHSVRSIQLWFTRLCLLVKLQYFETAESESNVWWDMDKPDLYYQCYPELYGGKLGTMVPFQMRILIANIPAYLQKYSIALERLYEVLSVVRGIIGNLENGKTEDGSLIELSNKERQLAKQLWSSRESRVQHSIVNVALMSKNYILAIEVLLALIAKNPSANQKRALHSALGRVFLQLGDVANADICFASAKKLKRNQTGTLNSNCADLRELIDRGLISVSQNNYQEAYDYFQKASLLEPNNVMIINNMSLCLFYVGKLKKALELLTSTIQSNPQLALHESLLLNVCTLHELEGTHLAHQESLLKHIAAHKGDAMNINCLKLQSQVNK